MTFRDLKLPKDLSKKKKMVLYKCVLMPKGQHKNDMDVELNTADDNYSLIPEKAYEIAINRRGIDFYEGKDIIQTLKDETILMMAVTLKSEVMDECILMTKLGGAVPGFNSDLLSMNATIHDRIEALDFDFYTLGGIGASDIFYDSNMGRIIVKDPKLLKVLIA